jgi:hypothetical protein
MVGEKDNNDRCAETALIKLKTRPTIFNLSSCHLILLIRDSVISDKGRD